MNSSNIRDIISEPRKIKYAVCFSGDSTHWESAVQSIKWFFEYRHPHPVFNLPIQTDYFIHTWKTNSNIDLEEEFKPKCIEIEEPNAEQHQYVKSSSDFYSLEKSLMLKRVYELEKNFRYDVVVNARLNVIYNPGKKFPLDQIYTKICYTTSVVTAPANFSSFEFDNTIFYGDSPTMDFVGDLYSSRLRKDANTAREIQRQEKNVNLDLYYSPGCLLYNHIIDTGVHPEMRTNIEYTAVTQAAADKNLKGIYDYNEIKKLGQD